MATASSFAASRLVPSQASARASSRSLAATASVSLAPLLTRASPSIDGSHSLSSSSFFSPVAPQRQHQRQLPDRSGAFQVAVASSDVAAPAVKDIEFVWTGPGNEVLLTGDFLNWDSKLQMSKAADNTFTVSQKLPPGKYMYKFIVDGVWQHSSYQPTVADGAGGFNNVVTVEDPTPKPTPTPEEDKPAAAAAAAPAAADGAAAAAPAAGAQAGPKANGAAAGKKVVAGKVAGKKKAASKPIGAAMEEDIIPALRSNLAKEDGLLNLELAFKDNELTGSFLKNNIPYSFWAYFPDGTLDGARGFSLTSCGNPPSTVEPFIIDERKITPELVVFWVTKRLFAQKLLSLN